MSNLSYDWHLTMAAASGERARNGADRDEAASIPETGNDEK
ncbi:MAG TPA: hypothetical protein VGV39_00020 [Mesorhizobium sp.]|jgi:hypothetical protein|nr:hypothetical protein [Mesorhizobium sp.]HEV2501426.1 hypothetical protein [Mesorhizobium sp.]